MSIEDPNATLKVADQNGQLSLEFQQYLIEVLTEIRATLDDLESRVTALEP